MKIATAITILVTVITSSEGKKSKTSNDYYHSKDGDRFAARWGHDDDDSSSSNSSNDWWSGKSGKSGYGNGSSAFHCSSETFYLNVDDLLDEETRSQNGFFDHYADYRVYKESSEVSDSSGDTSYDGVFAYKTQYISDFSCQGQGMLGLDGGPKFDDQIYFNTLCDPKDEDSSSDGFITPGGITGGFGRYRGATGTVEYEVSGDTGKLKFWICLPNGLSWGSSSESSSETSSSWDH